MSLGRFQKTNKKRYTRYTLYPNSLYPVYVNLGCVVKSGILYIRNSLYPVSVKSGLSCVVIFGIHYIRNSLYPICVKSVVGCVTVEGTPLPFKCSM